MAGRWDWGLAIHAGGGDHAQKVFHCTVARGPKMSLRGVTPHLVTDMCMYSHEIVGVGPQDYGRAMVEVHMSHTHRVGYI
jgi:hypothetical protein